MPDQQPTDPRLVPDPADADAVRQHFHALVDLLPPEVLEVHWRLLCLAVYGPPPMPQRSS